MNVFGGGNSLPPDKQPVGVDAVGRTGDKGAEVAALYNFQPTYILRLHHAYLVHLIGENRVQDIQLENIPFNKPVQICKQLCGGKPSVPRQKAVGAWAAGWQTAPAEMSHSRLEHRIVCIVVDGQ